MRIPEGRVQRMTTERGQRSSVRNTKVLTYLSCNLQRDRPYMYICAAVSSEAQNLSGKEKQSVNQV
jgi:hypothetical protein